MNKFIKITLIVLAVIAAILIAGVVIFLRIIFPPALSQEATEKDFVKNQEDIMIVTNYLINSKYNEMSIHHTDDLDGYITIDDPQVIKAMNSLLKHNGYKRIAKDGNTIYFLRSSPTMDFGSGVVYSIDGGEPQLQYLTKLEPLSEPNWYYYEQDFNEFRRREQSQ